MNSLNDEIIQKNNSRILSMYEIQPRFTSETKKTDTHENSKTNTINNNHKRLLMAVYNSQYQKTLTEICKEAGFPAGTGSRIAEECVKNNLIKMIHVPFGRGRPKYPVLLPEAYTILNIEEKTSTGRGAGHEHTLYQYLIKDHFSDFKPKIELNRNNKCIDVAIETNESLIAIEVAMTSVHEKENIEKDINMANANSVFVACINVKVQLEVKLIISQMSNKYQKVTKSLQIPELLKMKPEEIINYQPRLDL